ncbi:ATP-binding protein [Kitasatospora cineracea]|uniref:ATP-binding protein n=1 Tax=Kitasatospora cineracea TaxID=88074 RepID=UPI000F50D9D3|nr:ATP-binding protein [Kitasatospora cineracea]
MPATTPALARRLVRQLLRDAGPAAADGEADALLAVSELVTNANLHGGGVTAFTARTEAAPPATDRSTVDDRTPRLRLRVVVEDADSRPPRSHPCALLDPVRPGGRGWALVTRLAATWEVTVLPGGGKRISVTLAL